MILVRGQAIAEFLVALLMLIPLWAAVVYLTGLHEAHAAVVHGARYAAFDQATGVSTESETLDRVRRFVIDREAGPVRASGRSAGDSAWVDRPALWRDPLTQSAWARDRGAVTLRISDRALPGAVGAASAAAMAASRSAGPLGEPQPRLGTRDLRRVEVSLRLATAAVPALPDPFVLSARLDLLSNGWAAEGSADTRRHVLAMAPLRVLEPAASLIEPLAPLLQLFEPALRRFCPREVAVDIVPPDRLAPQPSPLALAEPVRC
jgi:hypothetical protein